MATYQSIINDINAAMREHGEGRYGWYVGITNNLRQRLFDQHRVQERGGEGYWLWRKADSEAIARAVEKAYIEAGRRGGTGGGTNPKIVYAYQITSTTVEDT